MSSIALPKFSKAAKEEATGSPAQVDWMAQAAKLLKPEGPSPSILGWIYTGTFVRGVVENIRRRHDFASHLLSSTRPNDLFFSKSGLEVAFDTRVSIPDPATRTGTEPLFTLEAYKPPLNDQPLITGEKFGTIQASAKGTQPSFKLKVHTPESPSDITRLVLQKNGKRSFYVADTATVYLRRHGYVAPLHHQAEVTLRPGDHILVGKINGSPASLTVPLINNFEAQGAYKLTRGSFFRNRYRLIAVNNRSSIRIPTTPEFLESFRPALKTHLARAGLGVGNVLQWGGPLAFAEAGSEFLMAAVTGKNIRPDLALFCGQQWLLGSMGGMMANFFQHRSPFTAPFMVQQNFLRFGMPIIMQLAGYGLDRLSRDQREPPLRLPQDLLWMSGSLAYGFALEKVSTALTRPLTNWVIKSSAFRGILMRAGFANFAVMTAACLASALFVKGVEFYFEKNSSESSDILKKS